MLHLGHQLADALYCLNCIGSGQLVNGDTGSGLAIQATERAVVLCAQFDPGDIFYPNDATIGLLAHDDVAKLFRRLQASLSQHGIGELLVRKGRLSSDLTCGVDCVLRLDRVGNVCNGDAKLCQLVRLYPQPNGILPRSEDLGLADTVRARDRIIQVDVGIVRQIIRIVRTMRRI